MIMNCSKYRRHTCRESTHSGPERFVVERQPLRACIAAWRWLLDSLARQNLMVPMGLRVSGQGRVVKMALVWASRAASSCSAVYVKTWFPKLISFISVSAKSLREKPSFVVRAEIIICSTSHLIPV